jgi:hypothetical protein
MLHEFEGILFSNSASFSIIVDDAIVEQMLVIKGSYPTPEYINSSPKTAPSKRLETLIPNYAKIKKNVANKAYGD